MRRIILKLPLEWFTENKLHPPTNQNTCFVRNQRISDNFGLLWDGFSYLINSKPKMRAVILELPLSKNFPFQSSK